MLALAALLFVAAPPSSQDAAAAAFMRETYAVTEYASARHDLDGDGADEILIRATNRDRCGSGGCALFVLSPKGDGCTVVMEATVVNPPVRVLNTATNGWKDLAVTVSGGGVRRPYEARLRFDGRRYPDNPTVPPAEAIAGPAPDGQILMPTRAAAPTP